MDTSVAHSNPAPTLTTSAPARTPLQPVFDNTLEFSTVYGWADTNCMVALKNAVIRLGVALPGKTRKSWPRSDKLPKEVGTWELSRGGAYMVSGSNAGGRFTGWAGRGACGRHQTSQIAQRAHQRCRHGCTQPGCEGTLSEGFDKVMI